MSSITQFLSTVLLLQLDFPLLLGQTPAIQIGYVPMRPSYHPNPGEYIAQIVPPGKPWPARPEDYPQFSQTTKPPQSQRTTIANRIKEDENKSVANSTSSNITLSQNSTDKPIQETTNIEIVTETSPIALNQSTLSNSTEKPNERTLSNSTEKSNERTLINSTEKPIELTTEASIKEEITKATVEILKDHSKLYTSKPLDQFTIADENDIILNKLNISLPSETRNVSNLLPFDEDGNIISNKTEFPPKAGEQLFNIKPTVQSNMKDTNSNNARPNIDKEIKIASTFIPPPDTSGCSESEQGEPVPEFEYPLVQNKEIHPVYEVKPYPTGYFPFTHNYNTPRLYHYRQAWQPKVNPFIPSYKPFFF